MLRKYLLSGILYYGSIGNYENGRSHKYDYQSKERHKPSIEVLRNYGNSGKDYIHVVIGANVKYPNSLQHQIQWIELCACTKMLNTIKIRRINFVPGTSPDALFRLIHIGKYREFCALAYCNVHG
ncbi:MAG: desulfoferrodoxin family protein [Methanohalophilus sp.]